MVRTEAPTLRVPRLPPADPRHFDELRARPGRAADAPTSDGLLAPHWVGFFGQVPVDQPQELDSRADRVARLLRDNGVTYNVYADDGGAQRPWSLELFPLLLTAADWQDIEAGVLQRTRLLEAVMADIYGAQALIADGLLPSALIHGHPDYQRPLHGTRPLGGRFLHLLAFDLARGPDGRWWVVAQRAQAPSGLGYLLENRMAISAQFPEAFATLAVRRLGSSYRRLIRALKDMTGAGGEAHLALLTPGPHNETHAEQSMLARYLGLSLVEGSDLTVRRERLYLKTLHGLRPVHGLIRRVDDNWVDPLEARGDSQLGAPGLMQAVRADQVLVANAIGSGVLESSALLGFLPALSQRLLDEELRLPALPTWWCGEAAAMHDALPRLREAVIKPTFPWSLAHGTFETGVGPLLGPDELAAWAERIQAAPAAHTVQAYLPPARMPVWQQGQLATRAAMLRVFVLSDARGGWQVLPGGMARLVGADSDLADMQQGGSSADVWVLGDPDRQATRRAARPERVESVAAIEPRDSPVTSRAAENLFWIGRYTERAENMARLARIALEVFHGDDEPALATQMWLGQMAVFSGLVDRTAPTPTASIDGFEQALIGGLAYRSGVHSVGHALRALRQAGAALREQLSSEHWGLIKRADRDFQSACQALTQAAPLPAFGALGALRELSRQLAAITGAQSDHMWRDDGWRLLSVGRQIERLIFLARALSRGFYTNAVHDAAGMAVVLRLFDASVSFHARYQRTHSIAALIEHVVLNPHNPRSVACVLQVLGSRLTRLHQNQPAETENLATRLQVPTLDQLGTLCQSDDIGDFVPLQRLLADQTDLAQSLSDTIALRHFSLVDDTLHRIES